MKRRSLLATSLALAFVVGCGAGAPPPPSDPNHPLLGAALPTFSRPALDGSTVSSEAMKGKPVVIELFAQYCEPCKRTLPALVAFAKEHPEVHVVGLGQDEREADVRAMVETFGVGFPVIHDRGNVLAGRLRVRELPAVIVADKTGKITWVHTGDAGGPVDLEAVVAE